MTLAPPAMVTEADLLAYVDGRLDTGRRSEVEAHLLRCPQDAGRIAADLALQEGLRLLFGRPAGPPRPLLPERRRVSWLARVAMAAGLAAFAVAAGSWAVTLEAAPAVKPASWHSPGGYRPSPDHRMSAGGFPTNRPSPGSAYRHGRGSARPAE